LRVFDWPRYRAGQPSEGRQPAEGSPQNDESIGNTAAGIAAASRLGQAKIQHNAALCNFSQVLRKEGNSYEGCQASLEEVG
jgi:hypothetical protein